MAVRQKQKKHEVLPLTDSQGFTLIEVIVAMVVASIIIAAVYGVYLSQQKGYKVQEQVVELQQNLRAAMTVLTEDVRMAGFDPLKNGNFGVLEMRPGQFSFSYDKNFNHIIDADERIDLGFSTDDDPDREGSPSSPSSLGRQTGGAGGYQGVADNIEAIEFVYFDEKGQVTTVPADVRRIRFSILARASRPDNKFSNTMTYVSGSGASWGPYNDHFRRRLLITDIQLRNIALNL